MQDSKGVYNATRNWVRGSMAACSESAGCAGVAGVGALVLGGLVVQSARLIVAGGTAGAAASGGTLLPEGEMALAVIHEGKVLQWTTNLSLSHAVWIERTMRAGLPAGATVVSFGKNAGAIWATLSKTIHGHQGTASQAVLNVLRAYFR